MTLSITNKTNPLTIAVAFTATIGIIGAVALASLYGAPVIKASLLSPSRLSLLGGSGISLIIGVASCYFLTKQTNAPEKLFYTYLASSEPAPKDHISLAADLIKNPTKKFNDILATNPNAPVQLYKLFSGTDYQNEYTLEDCIKTFTEKTIESGIAALAGYLGLNSNALRSILLSIMIDICIEPKTLSENAKSLALQSLGQVFKNHETDINGKPAYHMLIAKIVLSSLSDDFIINLLKSLDNNTGKIPTILYFEHVFYQNDALKIHSSDPSLLHLCINNSGRAEALKAHFKADETLKSKIITTTQNSHSPFSKESSFTAQELLTFIDSEPKNI